jgi:hypothetical protein
VSSCTNPSVGAGVSGTFTVIYKVNAGTASGTVITDTATVNATNQSYGRSPGRSCADHGRIALHRTCRERHHVYPDRDEQRSVSGNEREFYRGDAPQHYVSVGRGAGGMDVYGASGGFHRNC